jgi:RNA polymerase sigma factor (sigma-70 family)
MTTPHRHAFRNQQEMERAAGIEPASLAWKAKVLPLHNARAAWCISIPARKAQPMVRRSHAAEWSNAAIRCADRFTGRGVGAIPAAYLAESQCSAMTDRSEIDTLLRAVAARDADSFRLLYDRTCGYLMAVILRICRDRHVAEDLLQDVYVQVWRHADSFDAHRGPAIGWLAVIARHRAIDHIRSHGRIRDQMADNMQAELDRLPALTADVGQMSELRLLWRCLAQLQPQHRQAVLLAYYNGWSRDELAQHFNIPENTVKTWLRRGLISLRSCMDGD